ncbi:uncharacterized protein LOC142088451 [Calonectris borealis]|uniref:uncharacterized protein LOC142088451 n=1 Tax=Calonectris borealis TaxID=1323832 RepID=UPI003F4B13EA
MVQPRDVTNGAGCGAGGPRRGQVGARGGRGQAGSGSGATASGQTASCPPQRSAVGGRAGSGAGGGTHAARAGTKVSAQREPCSRGAGKLTRNDLGAAFWGGDRAAPGSPAAASAGRARRPPPTPPLAAAPAAPAALQPPGDVKAAFPNRSTLLAGAVCSGGKPDTLHRGWGSGAERLAPRRAGRGGGGDPLRHAAGEPGQGIFPRRSRSPWLSRCHSSIPVRGLSRQHLRSPPPSPSGLQHPPRASAGELFPLRGLPPLRRARRLAFPAAPCGRASGGIIRAGAACGESPLLTRGIRSPPTPPRRPAARVLGASSRIQHQTCGSQPINRPGAAALRVRAWFICAGVPKPEAGGFDTEVPPGFRGKAGLGMLRADAPLLRALEKAGRRRLPPAEEPGGLRPGRGRGPQSERIRLLPPGPSRRSRAAPAGQRLCFKQSFFGGANAGEDVPLVAERAPSASPAARLRGSTHSWLWVTRGGGGVWLSDRTPPPPLLLRVTGFYATLGPGGLPSPRAPAPLIPSGL